ncbi:hypothetical protein [Pseudonocardia sp. NPDC049635]|uniref:hypothetical protein n=1 Tax=Pseudonocardia sp. NPDC049635 TaxID=3155506 RepID=UPI0033D30C95
MRTEQTVQRRRAIAGGRVRAGAVRTPSAAHPGPPAPAASTASTASTAPRAITAPTVITLVAVLYLVAGCATTVPGTPWPAGAGPAGPVTGAPAAPTGPPTSFTGPADRLPEPTAPEPDAPTGPSPDPTGTDVTTRTVPPVPVRSTENTTGTRARPGLAPRGNPAASGTAPLTADVLADECLLGTDALTGLLGAEPAAPATNAEVARPDGARTRACFAVGGSSTAAVNVYTTNRGTPADHVRAAGGARPITTTGEGVVAALLETVAGPTVQIGAGRYLVTIAVAGRAPSEEQWQTAVRDAVSALPR